MKGAVCRRLIHQATRLQASNIHWSKDATSSKGQRYLEQGRYYLQCSRSRAACACKVVRPVGGARVRADGRARGALRSMYRGCLSPSSDALCS